MAEAVSVRIPEQQMQEIEHISTLAKKKKSETLREIVDLGLHTKKLELALEKFRKKEATAWKAARLADMPLTSFLDVLKEKNMFFHYSKEELEQDFKGFT